MRERIRKYGPWVLLAVMVASLTFAAASFRAPIEPFGGGGGGQAFMAKPMQGSLLTDCGCDAWCLFWWVLGGMTGANQTPCPDGSVGGGGGGAFVIRLVVALRNGYQQALADMKRLARGNYDEASQRINLVVDRISHPLDCMV